MSLSKPDWKAVFFCMEGCKKWRAKKDVNFPKKVERQKTGASRLIGKRNHKTGMCLGFKLSSKKKADL